MCTLVVAASVIPGHPLVVIANRDEQLARPSSPPLSWAGGFLAPRDERAGGTWLGLNRHGVFVGVTNRYLGTQDAERQSRGALVASALERSSARAIHEALATLPADRHNGFHLVYADASDVFATVSDGRHLAQLSLGRGRHVVTERSFGAGDDHVRRARIDAAWSRVVRPAADADGVTTAEALAERLTLLLAEHDDADPLGATCIHLDALGYGTKSGMVLVAAPKLEESTWLWAEGPPCTTAFTPVDVVGWLAGGET